MVLCLYNLILSIAKLVVHMCVFWIQKPAYGGVNLLHHIDGFSLLSNNQFFHFLMKIKWRFLYAKTYFSLYISTTEIVFFR